MEFVLFGVKVGERGRIKHQANGQGVLTCGIKARSPLIDEGLDGLPACPACHVPKPPPPPPDAAAQLGWLLAEPKRLARIIKAAGPTATPDAIQAQVVAAMLKEVEAAAEK